VIPEADFYYGAALVRLTKELQIPLAIEARPDIGAGAFEVSDRFLLLVKFCSKRLSPWTFTFPDRQVSACASHASAQTLLLCLMCGSDGTVALSNQTAVQLLGAPQGVQSWIRVSRRRRQMYTVSGLGGDLESKVADSDFERLAGELIVQPASSPTC
jgi:hypothetical protein